MPRQIRIVCLHNVSVLCFVNNGLADKTSTEPGLEITPHENAVHVTAEYDHYCVACTTAWNERSRAILYV